jgi:hypothetical protein
MDNITGNGLKILLLGSYDPITKPILRNLRLQLNENFSRYSCFTILLENLDVHISSRQRDILLFEYNEDEIVCTILEDYKIVETLSVPPNEFKEKLGIDAGLIAYNEFRKLSEMEKVKLLAEWSDLVLLVKHREDTRGGELVEMTYLLFNKNTFNNSDPLKYIFFHRKDICISTMVKELITLFGTKVIPYKNESNLCEEVNSEIKKNITRLNLLESRFKVFEMT